MNKNPQIKYLAISNILFFTMLGAFWFLYNQVVENNRQAGELELAWQEESTKLYDLNSLSRTLKSIGKEVAELDEHFVEKDNVVPFLAYLENLGNPIGVKTEISAVDSADDGTGEKLNANLNITGNFSGVYKYVTLLENAKYEMEILSLEMKRQDPVGVPNPKWGANIRIKLLSFMP